MQVPRQGGTKDALLLPSLSSTKWHMCAIFGNGASSADENLNIWRMDDAAFQSG